MVGAPTAEYMPAMKCVSARFDFYDKDDVVFLIQPLGLRSPQEVFAIIARYYPSERVPAKTRFLVEELLKGSRAESEDWASGRLGAADHIFRKFASSL